MKKVEKKKKKRKAAARMNGKSKGVYTSTS